MECGEELMGQGNVVQPAAGFGCGESGLESRLRVCVA
jgi:hypothetical protein